MKKERDEIEDFLESFITEEEKSIKSNLTPHQVEIMNNIFTSLREGNKKILLQGSAGVGKTFLMNILVKEYRTQFNKRGLVFITAPTNKAVAVLLDKAGDNVEYYMNYLTIHKALQLKRIIDDKTGETSFQQKIDERNPPFKNCDLLIVDEASMISSEILKYIQLYENFPIIFVADDKQLNPVGEEDSPVFHQNYPVFELIEIIRQAEGNPIIDLSRNLYKVKLEEECLIENKGYSFTRDQQYVIEKLISNPREIRYLSWTNAEVDRINRIVRDKLFLNPSKLEVGELIVLSQPYGEYWTNYELEVNDLQIKEKKFFITKNDSIELTYYLVNKEIFAIHENSQDAFMKKNKELKSLCRKGELNWSAWYSFIETFIRFQYLYAISVHKSQGSTYRETFINVIDLERNKDRKEKQRLWYTAITRASDKVNFFIPPFNKQ